EMAQRVKSLERDGGVGPAVGPYQAGKRRQSPSQRAAVKREHRAGMAGASGMDEVGMSLGTAFDRMGQRTRPLYDSAAGMHAGAATKSMLEVPQPERARRPARRTLPERAVGGRVIRMAGVVVHRPGPGGKRPGSHSHQTDDAA